MKTIVVTNRKGGVGKTTTATHLAVGLEGRLGGVPDVCDLLIARQPERLLEETMVGLPGYPALRVIRSNCKTRAAVWEWGAANDSRRGLGRALHNVIQAIRQRANGSAPYIILDTPPGLGPLQTAGLVVADYVLIPVNPNFASETSLAKMVDEIRTVRESGGKARLLGILPTRVKPQTTEHREMLAELADIFGQDTIYPIVRDTIKVEEAQAWGRTVWDYDHRGIGARDYLQVLKRFMRDLGISLHKGRSR